MLPGSTDNVGFPPRALLLVSPRLNHGSLPRILRGTRWDLQHASTANDALRAIRRQPDRFQVVICEDRLPDGNWKSLLAELERLPVQPSLVVCSRLADERLWVDVLKLGAFDLLLCAPFVPGEVLRITENAWTAWTRAVQSTFFSQPVHDHVTILATLASGNPI